MLEKGKINSRQFTILVILFTVGTSILIQPSAIASAAKQDAWLSTILGSMFTLLLVLLFYAIGKRFSQMTLVEYSEVLLGKWLGKAVSILYCFLFFYFAWTNLREIGEFLTTQIMPETPIEAIEILFLSIVVMGVRLGLEVLTRAGEIFFPWVIVLFLFLAINLMPDIKLENMQPIFEEGIKPILNGSIVFLGVPSLQLVLFLMIIPFVEGSKGIRKSFLIGSFIGCMILIIVSLLTTLVLGADLTSRQIYPSLALAKKITLGGVLERLESIMVGIWFLTLYFKLTLGFYASVLGFAQTFKLKEYRFLVMPMSMIMLVFSLVAYPNRAYFITFLREITPVYHLIFGLVLPFILLGIAYFRKIKIQSKG